MRQYELTYLISDNVPESELNKVTGKIGGYVTSLGGKILKEEIWGRRKLAYPIQKQDFATYVTINFDLPADKANELEHNIFLSSKIVRHLMLVKDYGQEELVLTAEDIAETEEIKEVIGGERSFEAVEGETEESKDLMAVRGEEEAEEKEEVAEEAKVTEEKPAEEVKEEKPAKKPAKKAEPKEEVVAKEEEDPHSAEATRGKPAKKPAKKAEKKEDEADRLSKLDKELDDILGDDL